jgi:hypothetical protein
MTADAFLDHLAGLGIRLVRDGESLAADVLPGADLSTHLTAIHERKGEVLAALDRRARLCAYATRNREQFDRATFDALWRAWETDA